VTDPLRDRTLALAGVFQAARLTQQLAREGQADKAAFAASVHSLLALDAASTEEVYGGVGGLRLGLALLRDKFGGPRPGQPPAGPPDLEVARYAIALLQLERAVARRDDLLAAIRRGIETAENQMKFFAADGGDDDSVHPTLVEKLAELYSQTLSTLTPRIMVSGEHGHLGNPAVAARVRSALFAGVRSAVLWRQKGGSRWQLLFGRRALAQQAAQLLAAPAAG
jgi:high frequency lysogenization protein